MTSSTATLVSILVPVFNEEANVDRAYNRITAVFASLPDHDCEIIFTDNHSTDDTHDRLLHIAARDDRVRIVRFARNYGYQRSVLMAYQKARGDCSIQIDCDLQDPPELIPQMLDLWRQGNQVVYGIRRSLPDGLAVATVRRIFYRLITALSDDRLPVDAGEFRLVDRKLLDEMRTIRDTSPYVRGVISAMGFTQVGFPYDRHDRVAGSSKFPLRKMIGLGLNGILNHSLVPLRMASAVGLTVGVSTMILIVGYLIGRLLFGQHWPAGFATTTMLLLLGITLNALFLGIIGEYLGRIYIQVKARPGPIVEMEVDRTPLHRFQQDRARTRRPNEDQPELIYKEVSG
ncbi:glycosyltransferase [Sphingobium sp. SCG-1]|uniref:glycosyltransferase family 2 protein n=1 Tax=Sphingobium sp. SCG-1 TaxID=2072936 RepID=UPI000CD6C588|nr:glycosyltransferase family 2 protein [Sphingobium sp. SCG-1]AUW57395.1 glycosyltransferase [Sphingobium sp. SCG-1]